MEVSFRSVIFPLDQELAVFMDGQEKGSVRRREKGDVEQEKRVPRFSASLFFGFIENEFV